MPITYTLQSKNRTNRTIWITASLVVVGLVASVFLSSTWAKAAALPISAVIPSQQLSYSAGPAVQSTPSAAAQAAPVLELHIANNGLVLLRGARVESIDGTTIQAETDFPGGNFIWMIHTNTGTQFPTADAANATISAIHVGDIVEVTGLLAGGSGQLAIDAQFVRDGQ